MSQCLSSSARPGRSEIKTQRDVGVMGDVYLALDAKLNETVTIKLLPGAFALSAAIQAIHSGTSSNFGFESPKRRHDLRYQ